MDLPTRHLQLRDGHHWIGRLSGLEADRDGALRLIAVPGPADGHPVELPPPYDLGASGIAAGPCDSLFVADTEHHRVRYIDTFCDASAWLGADQVDPSTPGNYAAPRGLLVSGEDLLVADSGNRRVQSLTFPALEPHLAWEEGLDQPVAQARDAAGRVYVLDAATRHIRRFDPVGRPDPAFDAALATNPELVDPRFLCIDERERLLVSDDAAAAVLVFDLHGQLQQALPAAAGARPGALAAGGGRLYVADRGDGTIRVFADDRPHGSLPGFRGPVTALALTPGDDLLIKPGLDQRWYRFNADTDHLPQGELTAGPFDAGEALEWFSATLEGRLPPLTRITWQAAQRPDSAPDPAPADWIPMPADAALLAQLLGPGGPPRRWLWLHIQLQTSDPAASPLLQQVRARTPGEDYLAFLPAIYAIEDRPTGFLRRLLGQLQTGFEQIETGLEDMPRHVDPQRTDANSLAWLADWLACELPRIADDQQRRELLTDVVALHARRGTLDGLRDLVERHTGIRPHIVEDYRARRLWILGESSRLDFDTALPPLDPNGMVLPDPEYPLYPDGDCCPVTLGRAVVGESGPLTLAMIGEPLFQQQAHRFLVYLPAHRLRQRALIDELCRVLDAEKPAHTDYRLCIVEPLLRVGLQSTIGVDTLVGGPPGALALGSHHLNLDARLPAPLGGISRVGQDAAIGQDIVLG